ncbi:GroEL equatorial domain-like protein [Fistulina hepatica ATCC 64428]|nr:GroEL equatorial domain-like protein [Fistulina hepatica ATCC 64428]
MSAPIFAEQATEEKAENARQTSFVGAMAIGDLVKSTLGPKGMSKIMQSASTGEINITNDAAKILVSISKVLEDNEVGDGTTTSMAVLASEVLREAEKLIANKIHPQMIVEGMSNHKHCCSASAGGIGSEPLDFGPEKWVNSVKF